MLRTTVAFATTIILAGCGLSDAPTSPPGRVALHGAQGDIVFDGTATALQFDGVDDYVDLGLAPAFTTHTIEAWVMLTTTVPDNRNIVGPNGADANGCYTGTSLNLTGLLGGQRITYVVGRTGCGNDQVVVSPPVGAGVWHHLAGSWDGSTMRLYIDGNLAGQAPAATFDPFDHMLIGAYWNKQSVPPSATGFFPGIVHEIRLWDHARSLVEIRSDMCASGKQAGTSPIGYWPVQEGHGQSVLDLFPTPPPGSPASPGDGMGILGANADPAGDPADPSWTSVVGHRCRDPQLITVTSSPPSPAIVGTTYVAAATGGDSDNPLVISSLSPSVCAVAASVVSLIGSGSCTIAFNQAGDDDYEAATQVTQAFLVSYPVALKKDACKDDGWQRVTRTDGSLFTTQGDCIQFVNTGK